MVERALLEIDDSELAVRDLFRAMLAEPAWLVPLAQAQQQYRSSYYGLTAASLLEDVWFDAVYNYAGRSRPDLRVDKAARGALGDYEIGNATLSHKNVNGPQSVAVHWDALVAKSEARWTSETPVVLVSAGHGVKTGLWQPDDATVARARAGYPAEQAPKRSHWCLVRWAIDGTAIVLESWSRRPEWRALWSVIASELDGGVPAFELDLVILASTEEAGRTASLEIGRRPGAYLLPRGLLRDVPLTKNNRGSILTQPTVADLMSKSAALGMFTPMPMWSAHYARPRPPDLYLAQRTEFDRLFSPAR